MLMVGTLWVVSTIWHHHHMSVLIEDTLVTSLGHVAGKDYIRSSPPAERGSVMVFTKRKTYSSSGRIEGDAHNFNRQYVV